MKTRLARTLGAIPAAQAYRELADRTIALAARARERELVDAVEIWCAPDTTDPAFRDWAGRCGATLHAQRGRDLGERMANALESAVSHGRVPMLVGSDCPALDLDYLGRASDALDTNDAVVGPSEDGGYVLIGVSRSVAAFDGIDWSTPGVLAQTRRALSRDGARWTELEVLWDVDTAADFERWQASPTTTA